MSNQFLKLRRSAVPGKIPDTSSLDYGEIALNTYDGLAFMKKSGSNGEEIVTVGSTEGAFTGSFSGSFTGSLEGTSSWAINAISASYVPASGVVGLSLFQISTGSITASVGVDPSSMFLIKSGSTTFVNITSLGDTTVNSNLFIIKNMATQQPVLTVSQSVVIFATQSIDPSGITEAGSIWFTSASMYIGLE